MPSLAEQVERAALYTRTLSHVTPRQMIARAMRLARCRIRGVHSPSGAARSPRVADIPPEPVLPGRPERVTYGGPDRPEIRILNRWLPLACVEWEPGGREALEYLHYFELHYMEYLHGLRDEDFVAAVLDWIDRNRLSDPSACRYGWHSYPLSLRSVVWMQQLSLRRETLPRGVQEAMSRSLVEQIRWLDRNLEWDIPGNHLVKNVKALLWAGVFFEGEEADVWRRRGERILRRQLAHQILGDGMHFERSHSYHMQVLEDLLECLGVARDEALRSELRDAVQRMGRAFVDLMHPDGLLSQFNDSSPRTLQEIEACTRLCEDVGDAELIPSRQVSLPAAGYFGWRDGDDLLLVDCGPIGPDHLPGHGHGDILAFEWSVAAQRVVVDAGVYGYEADDRRRHARGTSAHNTVTVDGHDQCEFWGSFRVGRRGRGELDAVAFREDAFTLRGHHSGFEHLAGRPVHHRSIELADGTLTVEDEVRGGDGQEVRAYLLLHPDCRIVARPGGPVVQRGDVELRFETTADFEIRDAPWFPDFGEEIATRQIAMAYGSAPCAGSFSMRRV